MKLIISNTSMVPIYEQVIEQIKAAITEGELKEGDMLPSVRTMAKDLKISALTVKKSYDQLEEEGYVSTVHGKGTFILAANKDRMKEEQIKEVEEDFSLAIQKGKRYGLTNEELKDLFEIQLF